MFAIIAIIITATAVALGSLGSAGGGGSSPPPSAGSNGGSGGGSSISASWIVTDNEANIYRTAEYNAQTGLETINAAKAYAALAKNNKTIAGSGVKIAITDSGAQENHIDIAQNLSVIDNYNYNKNSTDIADNIGAGTYAASLAAGVKNNYGIHGVAYDATLVIADIYNDAGTELNANAGISGSAAIDSVKIINAGWKYGSYTTYNGTPSGTNASDREVIAALQMAQSRDILTVAAVGNDANNANDDGGDPAYLARPKPAKPALFANNNDLAGYVLAVGAVDANYNIADFSNICGITKDYCLVASGVDIKGAASDTNAIQAIGDDGKKYATISTSYAAAAQASGAAAVLRAAWPHLSAAQTSNILLTTATDLGTAGVDSTYGHGLLNLYGAVQAQGSNNFSYGASVNDSHYDLRQSSIAVDPIFGDAFALNVGSALKNAVFFDDYGRDYKANLDSKINNRGRFSAIANLSNNIGINNYKTNILPLAFGEKNSPILSKIKFQIKSYTDSGKKFATIDRSKEDKVLTYNNGFSFAQNISTKAQFGFAFNIDEIRHLSFDKINNFGFVSFNGFALNPYQSFINNNHDSDIAEKNFNQIFFQHKFFVDELKFNLSHQTSYRDSSLLGLSHSLQNKISDFNLNYSPNNQMDFSFSLGNLQEFNNNLLNSQAIGAFESGSNARTSYFKIATRQKLFKNIDLIANFSEGITKIRGNNLGIFRDYQDIRSRSFALGLIAENIFQGRFGVVYSEPLRVYSGRAKIDIPIARDLAGNTLRYQESISLKPQGKEQNLEIFYAKNINQFSQIGINFLVTKDVGNIKTKKIDQLLMMNCGIKF